MKAITSYLTIVVLLCAVPGISPLAGQQTTPQQSNGTIRVDVDLVLVNVTVTDSRSRFVEGMRKEHFRIWEDKVEQDILTFSNEDAPVSLGIIVDRSGSMGEQKIKNPNVPPEYRNKFEEMRTTAFSCLKGGIRDDEYFLIEFSNSPQVVADLTNDMSKLREKLLFAGPGGLTALWDAIYLGAAEVQKGTHPRKALLVLTDGLENNSRYTLSQLKNVLREQDVRIYSYGGGHVTFDGLNSLTTITGGRTFMGSNPCKELEAELRTQYVIGYRPTNRTKDGEFRRITVRINSEGLPKNISGLTVRARQGYFATP
jgi:Ca-activated chloride channel homolog